MRLTLGTIVRAVMHEAVLQINGDVRGVTRTEAVGQRPNQM